MEVFEVRLTVPCSAETAFDFVTRPENIRKISPPDVGLAFTSALGRYAMGSRIEFKVQAFGLVREIVHEVTAFDEPGSFIEEQTSGPFQKWIHEHQFQDTGDGRVIIIDRIEFEKPGGVVGLIMTADRIRENLEIGFDFRHEKLEQLLGGAPPSDD